MARINGTPTANLSVPQFSPKDDLNKATFNELLRTLDTRINIVADETQALVEHEANTAGVHGITDTNALATDSDVVTAIDNHAADTTSVHGIPDTSVLATDSDLSTAVSNHAADTTSVHGIADTSVLATNSDLSTAVSNHSSDTTSVHGIANTSALVATTDTPADGEVLTYTTAGGVNWAAAAGGGGSGITVAWAGYSDDNGVYPGNPIIQNWYDLVTSADVTVTLDANNDYVFQFNTNGVYQVSFNASLIDYTGANMLEVQFLEVSTSIPYVHVKEPYNQFGQSQIASATGVFNVDGVKIMALHKGTADATLSNSFYHSLSILKLA